jgi:hypothetical protein
MSLFEKEEWYIVTTAADSTFKVWQTNGTLRGSLNINHPLPVLWDISSDNRLKFKTQFLYAMKIMQQINQQELHKHAHRVTKMDEWL